MPPDILNFDIPGFVKELQGTSMDKMQDVLKKFNFGMFGDRGKLIQNIKNYVTEEKIQLQDNVWKFIEDYSKVLGDFTHVRREWKELFEEEGVMNKFKNAAELMRALLHANPYVSRGMRWLLERGKGGVEYFRNFIDKLPGGSWVVAGSKWFMDWLADAPKSEGIPVVEPRETPPGTPPKDAEPKVSTPPSA